MAHRLTSSFGPMERILLEATKVNAGTFVLLADLRRYATVGWVDG